VTYKKTKGVLFIEHRVVLESSQHNCVTRPAAPKHSR